MNSVLTNNTVVPIYNEFSFDKWYSCSHLQWIQFWQTIQLFPFTMNSVLTSDTVVPIYNEFSFDKQYSCSYLQWIQLSRAIYLVHLKQVTIGSTYNEFGNLQSIHLVQLHGLIHYNKQDFGFCLRVWLKQVIQLVLLKMSSFPLMISVTESNFALLKTSSVMSNTVFPTYNVFAYYKQWQGPA